MKINDVPKSSLYVPLIPADLVFTTDVWFSKHQGSLQLVFHLFNPNIEV